MEQRSPTDNLDDMRRLLPLLMAVSLVAAACSDAAVDTSLTDPPPTVARPEAMLLSYTFEPGTTFRYEVDLEQHIELSASGDPAVMGGEEVPGSADLDIRGTTIFTHTVSEGTEPGTFDITIVGDFSDLEVSGTVDGEPVDDTKGLDFAEMDPVESVVTVDEQGNIISGGSEGGLVDSFGGELGGMGAIPAPGIELGNPVGPRLADREVTVGDSWTETVRTPLPFTGEVAVTEVTSTVTGTDTADGAEVLVIETESATSGIELDLGEMMVGFFQSFMTEEGTPSERAEIESMMEDMRFVMSVSPNTQESITWFDPSAGYARRSQSDSAVEMSFDINMPDEASGEMIAMTMDMLLDQRAIYRLLDLGSA